jgi:thiamine transport system substrate-binding protein
MKIIMSTLIFVLVLSACASGLDAGTQKTLTVMTHDSFSISEEVIAEFEKQNNIKVSFIKSGDTGAALNRAILTKEAPLADVFYGVDNNFLSRALDAGIFESYDSALLVEIPDQFKLDPTNSALPVDYGDVCINYDLAYFEQMGLEVPASLESLTNLEYEGLLVVENPVTSSPGLAFLLATIAHFGEDGYLDYWRLLKSNALVVVNDWETAYYSNFSGSSGHGEQPMVLSYASSPAAEIIFSDPPRSDAPTASLVARDSCFRQIEFAGILRGTGNRRMAEKFMDFLLGVKFQEDIPLQMFMFPVNPAAKLPDVFKQFAQIPDNPATLSPDLIEVNREKWLEEWTEVVLQ